MSGPAVLTQHMLSCDPKFVFCAVNPSRRYVVQCPWYSPLHVQICHDDVRLCPSHCVLSIWPRVNVCYSMFLNKPIKFFNPHQVHAFLYVPTSSPPLQRATLYVILCLWYIIRPHQPSYKVCYSTFLVEFFIQLHYFLDICYCKFLLLFPDPATVALHILFYIVEKLSPPPLIALHMLTYGSFLISSSSTLVQCMTVYCSGVSLLPVSPTTL